ncbi:MAG: hypothetical protein EOL97_07145 [Spirochaetia bacterium]|nr:hypothetical protein [Spirochaetia bacterium]
MKFAIKDNQRILANPLIKDAICPLCKNPVISKCGEIKIWHWSHKNNKECDSFSEGETNWHLEWKRHFPEECQEVIIGEHRADVKIKDIVIEFQNSPLSKEDIEERESFYGKMKWVLNGETIGSNINLFQYEGFYKFKWKWFPQSWYYSKQPIYIDLSYLKSKLALQIESYNQGERHYSTYSTVNYEWMDDYGNIHEGEYPHYETHSVEDTKDEIDNLEKRYSEISNKELFLIKKLSNNGTGWGKLISKTNFLKECEYGYYRN